MFYVFWTLPFGFYKFYIKQELPRLVRVHSGREKFRRVTIVQTRRGRRQEEEGFLNRIVVDCNYNVTFVKQVSDSEDLPPRSKLGDRNVFGYVFKKASSSFVFRSPVHAIVIFTN